MSAAEGQFLEIPLQPIKADAVWVYSGAGDLSGLTNLPGLFG
jgi:hypothetical protein